MPGLAVDLVEVGLLGLAGGGLEGNRTGDQRELEITLPIGATGGGHSELRAEPSAGEPRLGATGSAKKTAATLVLP